MRIHPTLLYMLLRSPALVAIPLSTFLALAVLIPREPLTWHDSVPLLFIAIHSALQSLYLAGNTSRFLATRGFSSTTLWTHALLASLIALAILLLPATLLLELNARSFVQQYLRENPLYPLMTPTEKFLPLIWLAAGIFFIPLALFARTLAAQPTSGRETAFYLFLSLTIVAISVFNGFPWLAGWSLAFTFIVAAVIAAVLLVASRLLHHSMEYPS